MMGSPMQTTPRIGMAMATPRQTKPRAAYAVHPQDWDRPWRAASAATPRGSLRVFNRTIVGEIMHSATEELLDEELGLLTAGGSTSRSAGPTPRGLRGVPPPKPKMPASTKTVEAAHDKLRQTRTEDQEGIRERAERVKQIREQRFEGLLDELLAQDELKCNVASMIRQQTQREFRKQANIYSEWNESVFGRIQGQLNRYLNPPPRAPEPTAGTEFRARLGTDADPAKRQGYGRAEEEQFRRTAESIVSADHTPPGSAKQTPTEDFDPLLDKMYGDDLEPEERARSRPVLDPTHWGQLRLQATPYGHFAQAAEASATGLFRTQLKQGNGVFIPSERDGVPAAGKRRTRFERNNLGILQGEFAARGESSQYKEQRFGGGTGAPGQDHFLYEAGTRVTDKEFPLGKRMSALMHMSAGSEHLPTAA